MKTGIGQVSIVEGYSNAYATKFDGVTSYSSASSEGYPTAAISVSAWIRIDSALDSGTGFSFLGSSAGISRFITFGKIQGGNNLVVRGGFSGGIVSHFRATPTDYNVGQWYHYFASFNGTTFTSRIDDVLVSATNESGETITYAVSNTWFLGRAGNYSPITVDEVSIWNRAINVSEVAASNLPIDIYGASGLVFHYRMGELYQSGSSTIINRAGSTNNMSLFNVSESTDFVSGAS